MGAKVSNSDSFIEEVTEEVRREKLFGYLRRYGWIGVVCVLLLVGSAAWIEYSNAQARATAEATGDALVAALTGEDIDARAQAIAAIETQGATSAVTGLLTAAVQQENGEVDAAAATLAVLAANQDLPALYRDLAAFKAAMLPVEDSAARMTMLEQLARPGEPFRLLALEQIAYLHLDAGDTAAAIATLRQVQEDAAVPRGLRERVQTLMVALGEPLPAPVTE